jgi:hypothetical protein
LLLLSLVVLVFVLEEVDDIHLLAHVLVLLLVLVFVLEEVMMKVVVLAIANM